MRNIGVGVIGTGFMGKAHCFAYRAVAGVFPGSLRPVLQSVADINEEAAEQAANQFGFLRWRAECLSSRNVARGHRGGQARSLREADRTKCRCCKRYDGRR